MLNSLLLTTVLLVHQATAHFYLSHPKPRAMEVNYNPIRSGCENQNTQIPATNTFKGGSYFVPRHGRTNHRGGYSYYGMIPLKANPSYQEMMKEDAIIHVECNTLNCAARDMNDGGKYVPDQDAQVNSCWGSGFTWPNTPGEYTLFWFSYGGFDSDQIVHKQLDPYGNCANIKITAGSSNSTGNGQCTFAGGDQTLFEKGTDKLRTPKGTCAYKRYVDPPTDYQAVKDMIRLDDSRKDDPAFLIQNVTFGTPSIVKSGKCKMIENVPVIKNGPWDGNNNAQPASPETFILQGATSDQTSQPSPPSSPNDPSQTTNNSVPSTSQVMNDYPRKRCKHH